MIKKNMKKRHGKEPLVVFIIANMNGASINYESKPILELCLKTLKKTTYRNYKVVIADDTSTDNSKKLVHSIFPKADFVVSTHERNFAKNNNNAIRFAFKKYNPDYIVILNNDIIVTDDGWLKHMVNIAESDSEVGIVSPKLIWPDGKVQAPLIRFKSRFSLRNMNKGDATEEEYNSIAEVEVEPGVSLLVKREVLEMVGLLDENYLTCFEDVDFCLRVRAAGYKIIHDGHAPLIHLCNFTGKTYKDEKLLLQKQGYDLQRNRFYFLEKHKDKSQFIERMVWYAIYLNDAVVDMAPALNGNILGTRIKPYPIKRLKLIMKAYGDSKKLIVNDKRMRA